MFVSVSNLTKSYNTGIITHVLKGVSSGDGKRTNRSNIRPLRFG